MNFFHHTEINASLCIDTTVTGISLVCHTFQLCTAEMRRSVFWEEKATPITMMEDTQLLQEMRRAHLNVHDLWQHLTQLLLIYYLIQALNSRLSTEPTPLVVNSQKKSAGHTHVSQYCNCLISTVQQQLTFDNTLLWFAI